MLPTFKTPESPFNKRSYEEVDSDPETRKYTRRKTNEHISAHTFFSTASGRNLTPISLTSLEKAKAIIDNVIDDSSCSFNGKNNIDTPIKIPLPTIKTSIGLPMKSRILRESNIVNLPINCNQNSKSKSTDSDIFENNNLIKTPTNFKSASTDNGERVTDKSPVFMMANGRKAPSYSMNALTKAGIIMNNDIWNTTSYKDDNSVQNCSADGSSLVTVLEDSLFKTKPTLDDNIFATSSRNNIVSKSSGFSTASGRSLAVVTEDSLVRAKQTLDDNTSATLTCNNNNNNDVMCLGFSIANGRNTSSESLNKTRKSRDNTIVMSRNVSKDSCFSTASGRGIAAISDESLKKVRRILNNDLSQNTVLQEKLQNNITGSCSSDTANSNLKFKVKETPSIHSRLDLKNKKNSSYQNMLSLPRTLEYNSANKLFDLASPLKRVRLRDIVPGYPRSFSLLQLQELGISREIINMSPKTAISYRFTGKSIADCVSTWGPREALSLLIESGANPNLIDERWVCNHYRWIVWKIASMIRSFPHEFRNWWDSKKVFNQLQYRYEREINNTHRSALKLIIEGDGTASMPMVLCVSDIIEEEVTPITLDEIDIKESTCKTIYSLELTDMWYKIRADVDQPLQRAISKFKIRVGYKLEICGAKIAGGFAGVPALDVSNSTRLKLSANSTKLAHWDAKLGFKRFHPYTTLRSLCPDGGHVFAIDIIILRKYPMIFRETMKDGTIMNRNEQEEEHAKNNHEIWLNNKIQSLINEYEIQHKPKNKYKSKDIRKRVIQDISKVTSGEQLYIMMQDSLEPSKLWQDLSSEQSEWLQDYIQKKEQEEANHMNKWVYDHLEKLDYTRKVIPFFKVRVCDYLNTSIINKREAIINVWQPNELLFNTIKESRRYKVYNLTTARNQNYPTPSLVPIRLSTMGRSTIWKEAKISTSSNALSFYSSRTITCLGELQKMESNNEVDIVVYILVVEEPFMSWQRFGKPIKIQTLLVTDNSGQLAQIEIKNISSNYMGDILKPKNILILLNMQYRAYDPKYGIYMLSTCDNTEIKRSPREEYTRHAKEDLENWIKNNYDLVNKCEATAIELCNPNF